MITSEMIIQDYPKVREEFWELPVDTQEQLFDAVMKELPKYVSRIKDTYDDLSDAMDLFLIDCSHFLSLDVFRDFWYTEPYDDIFVAMDRLFFSLKTMRPGPEMVPSRTLFEKLVERKGYSVYKQQIQLTAFDIKEGMVFTFYNGASYGTDHHHTISLFFEWLPNAMNIQLVSMNDAYKEDMNELKKEVEQVMNTFMAHDRFSLNRMIGYDIHVETVSDPYKQEK